VGVRVVIVPEGESKLAAPGTLSVPAPVTSGEALPPLEVKFTFRTKLSTIVGLKPTVAVRLSPAPRVNELPETMLNGAEVEAVPLSVPAPIFCITKLPYPTLPTLTLPRSMELGVTEMIGSPNIFVQSSLE
jgi:hypothetical protein